jgi:hypothetical protein
MYQNEVAFFPASGGALSSDQSHLLYWCATFAGDSGAALIKANILWEFMKKCLSRCQNRLNHEIREAKKSARLILHVL